MKGLRSDMKDNLYFTLLVVGSFTPFWFFAYFDADGDLVATFARAILWWLQGIWFLVILGIILNYLADYLSSTGLGDTVSYIILAGVIIVYGMMIFSFYTDDRPYDEETYIRTGCERIVAGSRGMECL
jgi:preprotein translocase subunit SecY